MGGVDLADQVLQPYQVASYNSFVLYKKAGNADTFLHYQEKVIKILVLENFVPGNPLESEDVRRLTERHFIVLIRAIETRKNLQRRCRVCSKRGMRHDTRYYCPQHPSLPALCLHDCFIIFHTEPRFLNCFDIQAVGLFSDRHISVELT
ncbi:unnamed protein product [Ranitomeya imitator]|uniref:PiggyBac transposable element-derived protein 4 C-terminal zinc-finger domain-containing protein n=1 Tax=Ranitomeya imitator TaxID=111125 RepID=A0ABN9L9I8_9NEOB|nr:unnamed protein product [Ranitomeya imitator]